MSRYAFRDLTLAGVEFKAGEEISDTVWAVVPERNRRAMASMRIVRTRVPELPPTPSAKAAPKRATARA